MIPYQSVLHPTTKVSYNTVYDPVVYNPIVYNPLISSETPQMTIINTTNRPITSVEVTYPTISYLPHSLDLNYDYNTKEDISKYFRFKTLDKWLHDKLLFLLNFLTVSGGKVDLISKLESYKEDTVDKDSDETIEKKVKFIEKYFLRLEDVMNILDKLHTEYGINWFDLHKHEGIVRDRIAHWLKKKFKKAIVGK